MGKKYIVELGRCERLYKAYINGNGKPNLTWLSPEVDLTPYAESNNLEQVRKEAYEKGYEDAEEKYNDGYSDGYDAGLDDAWEASRKIGCGTAQGGFSPEMMRNVFGTSCFSSNVFRELTASEAITKIKEYEEDKQRIKVWDEIYCVGRPDIKVCVTDVEDGNFSGFTVEHPDNSNIGHVYSSRSFDGWEKTGRHFTEIGTVIEKMRGEQDRE